MAQRRYAELAARSALPPHNQAADRAQQHQQADREHQQLVGQAEQLAFVQHDPGFHGFRHGAVILPAHIGEHRTAVLIDVQSGVVARVVGKQGDAVHPGFTFRQGDAVTRLYAALSGGVDHVLQQVGRSGRRLSSCMAVMRGVWIGGRQWCGFHRPGHGLLTAGVEAAGELAGLRYVVPHRRREVVPGAGKLGAPEAGPGHAGEQHKQQQQRAPKACHRVQVTP